MRRITLGLLTMLLLFGGLLWVWLVDTPDGLTIDQARIRLVPGGGPQAGYFILHNNTRESLHLQAANSEVFGSVMLHQSRIQNGQSQMDALDAGVLVAARRSIEFMPGGMHLMLMRSNHTLEIGDSVPITLELAGSDNQIQFITHNFIVVPLAP